MLFAFNIMDCAINKCQLRCSSLVLAGATFVNKELIFGIALSLLQYV